MSERVPGAPLPGEGLDAFRSRLSEAGRPVRLIPLGGTATLADMGPEADEAGVAYVATVPAEGGHDTFLHLWGCWGFARPAVNLQLAPELARISGTLPTAGSQVIDEVMVRNMLSDIEIADAVLVEHAITPLSFRIYPDTPISEVVELMLRRSVDAVPVVGEDHEVLGVITAGDILPHTLPDAESVRETTAEPMTARDLMTRSVLCVTEEQTLVEASRAMINRGVEQLPIVREGELVGFLERRTVLRAFADRVDVSGRPAVEN